MFTNFYIVDQMHSFVNQWSNRTALSAGWRDWAMQSVQLYLGFYDLDRIFGSKQKKKKGIKEMANLNVRDIYK